MPYEVMIRGWPTSVSCGKQWYSMKTCLSNTTKRKYDRIDFLESDGTGIIKRNCHAKSERETEKRCLVEDPCNYTKHKIIPYRIQITNK